MVGSLERAKRTEKDKDLALTISGLLVNWRLMLDAINKK